MKTAALVFGVVFAIPALFGGGAPSVDPKAIINESNSFLKDREPEMTAEEYPLYQKLAEMLNTEPDLAVNLLEGMMSEKEAPSPAFELILGNAYFNADQKDKAEVRYLDAVKRFPSFVRGWNNLGMLYYTREQYREAIPCFSKALSLGDHDAGTLGLLGYCLEHAGNPVAAEAAYGQAIAEEPENPDWMMGLLRIYIGGNRWPAAEALARALIRIHPSDRGLWLTDANLLLSEGKKFDALVVLESAADAGVADARELDLLADLYAEQGFASEAARTYRRVMALDPGFGERKLLQFAEALIAEGEITTAAGVLDELPNALSPSGQRQRLQARADLLAGSRRWPEARATLKELLKLDPLNGRALLGLGYAEQALGNPAESFLAFSQALDMPDSAYRASFELANLELQNRHYEKCAEYLEKALKLQKSDELEDYLARVKTLIEP